MRAPPRSAAPSVFLDLRTCFGLLWRQRLRWASEGLRAKELWALRRASPRAARPVARRQTKGARLAVHLHNYSGMHWNIGHNFQVVPPEVKR